MEDNKILVISWALIVGQWQNRTGDQKDCIPTLPRILYKTQEAYRPLRSQFGGMDRHTDTCQNITFPHPSDAGGIT